MLHGDCNGTGEWGVKPSVVMPDEMAGVTKASMVSCPSQNCVWQWRLLVSGSTLLSAHDVIGKAFEGCGVGLEFAFEVYYVGVA